MMRPGSDSETLRSYRDFISTCFPLRVITLLSVLSSRQSYSPVLAQLMRSKKYSCHIWRSHCIAAEGSCLLGC